MQEQGCSCPSTAACCLNPFRLPYQNAMNWESYKQQKFISYSLEAGKSKVKVPTDLMSGEGQLLVHRWMSSPCVLTWQKGKGAHWGPFYKSTNPIYEGSTLMA